MALKIEWTDKAKFDRKEIFTYWNWRNKSKEYSQKLNRLFNKHIDLLLKTPTLGILTDYVGVRYLIVRDFFIFYRVNENNIIIMRIWDSRQDPKRINEMFIR